jgi:hypothetical protein
VQEQLSSKYIKEKFMQINNTKPISKINIPDIFIELDMGIREAADRLNFEHTIKLRVHKETGKIGKSGVKVGIAWNVNIFASTFHLL